MGKAERQQLRLAQAQGGRAEDANELRAALKAGIGDVLDEVARVVVGVIGTVAVAARRIELERERRQPDVVLERDEVGAAVYLRIMKAIVELQRGRGLTDPLQ